MGDHWANCKPNNYICSDQDGVFFHCEPLFSNCRGLTCVPLFSIILECVPLVLVILQFDHPVVVAFLCGVDQSGFSECPICVFLSCLVSDDHCRPCENDSLQNVNCRFVHLRTFVCESFGVV